MKYLIAYYTEFQQMYFNKDMFLFPYYLSKRLGLSCHYYYAQNTGVEPLPTEYRGVKMHDFNHKHVNQFVACLDMIRCILLNAHKTQVVFLTHISWQKMLVSNIYKCINPNGNVVMMGDMEPDLAERLASRDFVFSKGIMGYLKKKLVKQFFKNSIVTIESLGALNAMQKMYDRNGWTKLVHVHPALDIDLCNKLNLKYKQFEEKENIFLYVGRIGNHQKNTDMILDALEKIDLKDWKFYLIGPMTNSFNTREKSDYEQRIQAFYENRPDLKEKVIFTGPIFDMKSLFEFYIRAKVFVLTSRHEGFCNALSEAAAWGCYIVSTDVGGAAIVSNHWKFGSKVKQENSSDLAAVLSSIINKELNIDPKNAIMQENITWEYMVNRVVDAMK